VPQKPRRRFEIGSGEAEHFAHIAHRGTDAIANDVRNHCGVSAAVFFVNVLNDLFSPVVLDIEIDVGRFSALDTQEALEQQVHTHGVDGGDAEAETHRTVGSAATPLAQNVLLPAVLNNLMHCQEVAPVVEPTNDLKLAFELRANVGGHTPLVSRTRAAKREIT